MLRSNDLKQIRKAIKNRKRVIKFLFYNFYRKAREKHENDIYLAFIKEKELIAN